MHLQFRRPIRAIQALLILLLFLLPICLEAQLFQALIESAMDITSSVNQVLLDMTRLSDDEEKQIGKELKKEVLKTKSTGKDSKFNSQSIFKDIVKVCQRKGLDYELTIINDTEFNAFAIAGGQIFLNTGLLQGLESKDEIAFVIAHELAHNELRHCINKIQHSVNASRIDPTLGSVVQLAYHIYSHPFSKSDERAADELGLQLMLKAGYKKAGAISFFSKLEKMEAKWEGTALKELNDFISTHPTAKERKKNLESK